MLTFIAAINLQKAGASWIGPRLSGGVFTCMCGLVSGSRMEKGLAFLAPFSSRCSHCIVLFLRMLPFPRTAGHGAETREHRRQQTDSVAVARALRPQFPFNDARCT
jgi:hypothetical protein